MATTASSDMERPFPPLLPRILSGSIGSIVTALAVTPLEVVKIRQQMATVALDAAQSTKMTNLQQLTCSTARAQSPCVCILNNGLMECIVNRKSIPSMNLPIPKMSSILDTQHNNPMVPRGTFALLKHVFRHEGFQGIYAGLAPTLVMSVPNTVLYFTAYDEIKARVEYIMLSPQFHRLGVPQWTIPLLAGSSARLVASFTTAPLELVRTRQAVRGGMATTSSTAGGGFMGLWSELKQMVRTEGATSLFRGLGPTLWRDVPFSAIYWFSIEQLKLRWKERSITDASTTTGDHHPTPTPVLHQAGQALINGAIAGMIAAACTTPFDVVKTRRQTDIAGMALSTSGGTTCATTRSCTSPAIVSCEMLGSAADTVTFIETNHGENNTALLSQSQNNSKTTFCVLRQVLHEEGVAGLWRGNTTRMIKVAPACAIMIACYEMGKLLFE